MFYIEIVSLDSDGLSSDFLIFKCAKSHERKYEITEVIRKYIANAIIQPLSLRFHDFVFSFVRFRFLRTSFGLSLRRTNLFLECTEFSALSITNWGDKDVNLIGGWFVKLTIPSFQAKIWLHVYDTIEINKSLLDDQITLFLLFHSIPLTGWWIFIFFVFHCRFPRISFGYRDFCLHGWNHSNSLSNRLCSYCQMNSI